MGRSVSVRVDLLRVGEAILEDIVEEHKYIVVYPGDMLGGPNKRDQVLQLGIDEIETGFVACPVCYNIYEITALRETLQAYPGEDLRCLSCNRVSLREILRKAEELMPR